MNPKYYYRIRLVLDKIEGNNLDVSEEIKDIIVRDKLMSLKEADSDFDFIKYGQLDLYDSNS